MEIEKLDNILSDISKNRSTVKKGDIIVAKIIRNIGNGISLVSIKGRNYTAFIKEKINGNVFLAKVLNLSPKLVLKFIKNLTKDSIKANISNYFFDYKKEFIQKLIISDNFVVDDFLNFYDENLFKSGKNIIPIIKKYLKTWYSPIIKEHLSKKGNLNHLKKLYHKFLVFQSLYNVYNLGQLSFLIPLRFGNKNFLLSMMVLDKKDDLTQSIFIRIYLNKNSEVILLIYLDKDTVSCSLSSNDKVLYKNFEKDINVLMRNLRNNLINKEIEINLVPYNYLSVLDDKSFKTIDIRM